ncbi:MAG: sigma-70 family RNA polymerase sigma factor [Candidatus Omnitrophica bacterium]|jgi:RNA polymerase sigma factor (sigma-70 family)|nr:sigma-70 family RNA polymerase sigma factor [Candidatus Omnitrophota bacterium]
MDFKILLEKITPALKAIARRNILTGFYDRDDLYQQMCLYLWQRFGEDVPIGMNEAYIIKACEFYLLNFLRRGRRMPVHLSMDVPIAEGDITFKDVMPDILARQTDLEYHISIDEIKRKRLTDKEREVLRLLLKGNTVREIASILGISHVMVLKYKKNIIKKARSGGYQK